MKKKIFAGVAVLTFTAIVGLNVKINNQDNKLDDLSLANVEALAGEGTAGNTTCWQEISTLREGAMSAELTHKTYCGDCKATLCRIWRNESKC